MHAYMFTMAIANLKLANGMACKGALHAQANRLRNSSRPRARGFGSAAESFRRNSKTDSYVRIDPEFRRRQRVSDVSLGGEREKEPPANTDVGVPIPKASFEALLLLYNP